MRHSAYNRQAADLRHLVRADRVADEGANLARRGPNRWGAEPPAVQACWKWPPSRLGPDFTTAQGSDASRAL